MGWEATHSAGWPLAGIGDAAAMMVGDLAAPPPRGVRLPGCLLCLERGGVGGWDLIGGMAWMDGYVYDIACDNRRTDSA